MVIYPIDEQLDKLMASFCDEETGEVKEFYTMDNGATVPLTEELMMSMICNVQMEFADTIKNLRNKYINLNAEAEAIKAEKMALAKRQKQAEDSADRTKRFLAYLTHGEKYTDGVVKISYRKSEGLVIDDKEELLKWAIDNKKFLKQPELAEGEIKRAIKNGEIIPFAHVEERRNIQVK